MQTAATAGVWKERGGEKHDWWSAKEGSRRCAANTLSFSFFLFFADMVAMLQTPVLVRQVKMKMHYSSVRHQLWIQCQRRGVEEEGRSMSCMCEWKASLQVDTCYIFHPPCLTSERLMSPWNSCVGGENEHNQNNGRCLYVHTWTRKIHWLSNDSRPFVSFNSFKKFAPCLRSRFKMNCRSIYPPHALLVLD